jgi:GNAT superfamily N-acetyltransferase
MDITYTNKITVEQYNGLRRAVGWFEVQAEAAEKGLDNTAFLIVANDNAGPVGMARIITDYGYVAFIADVIIHPDYQGKGLGRAIMSKVMEYAEQNITPGQMKYINLMAAKGKEGFYKKLGFAERPNDRFGPGMTQWVPA